MPLIEEFSDNERRGPVGNGQVGRRASADIETTVKSVKKEVSMTIKEVLAFKPYPTDAFPEPIRGLIRAGSVALNVDEAFIGTALLPVIASAIGNFAVIELKVGWTEPAALWAGFIGDSGTLKSPTLDIAMRHLRTRQATAFAEYEKKQFAYESDKREYDIARRQIKKGEIPPIEPESPVCTRYFCADTTVEALADRLSHAPRGLLVCRDELSGWFASFDAYRGGKGSLDMSHWLGLHGARDLVIDRKMKDSRTIFIKRGNVSIVGGIQPEILRNSLTAETYDNGLVSRLLLCWPPKRAKRWSEATIDDALQVEMDRVFDFIYGLTPKLDDNHQIAPYVLRLTSEAKYVWMQYYNRNAARQATASGYEAGILSKMEGAAARLALVLHFVRLAVGVTNDFEYVDADSFCAGVTLAEWYSAENLRVHAVIQSGDRGQEQWELIQWIQQQGGKVTAKRLRENVRRYREGNDADMALQALVTAGFGQWINCLPGSQGGRPTRIFQLVSMSSDIETPLNIANREVSMSDDNGIPAYRPTNYESAFDAFSSTTYPGSSYSSAVERDEINAHAVEPETA